MDLIPEQKFIQIDEEGYALFGETRVSDEDIGRQILSNLAINKNHRLTTMVDDEEVIVEAFDAPLIAQQVEVRDGQWILQGPYRFLSSFKLENLRLDEWDRFHGLTDKGMPFVFSRKAQAHFFNLLEDYTDDSISFQGQTFEIPPSFKNTTHINKESWWSDIYRQPENPGWNLNEPTEALKDMLPRLKLPKSRILVLGCGEGHDAALFAEFGHKVTAIDMSPEAILRGKEKYGHFSNLEFIEADFFKLGPEFNKAFDIVFEHTCYCAINPLRRNELVQVWSKCLAEKGFLMGVFFATYKQDGPPFGASEWELRERTKKLYQYLFWGRWRQSAPKALGKELFVYAQRRV